MPSLNLPVPCHPVAEADWFMQRAAFVERRCMEILAAWVWNTGDLDCKLQFGTHAFDDATHADLCMQRASELRPSLPAYGWEAHPLALEELDAVLREIAQTKQLALKLCGLYHTLKPWLLAQYEEFLATADPILEGPSVRLLEQIIQGERRQIAWGEKLLRQMLAKEPTLEVETLRWQAHLEGMLKNASATTPSDMLETPLMSFTGELPAIDPRMRLIFYVPGKGPSGDVNFDPQGETEIQQIMLTTLVTVEAEAAELLCRILVEYPELPWLMRLQLCRQMWDECRHAASQWRLLRGLGADLGVHPAVAYINGFVGDEPDVFKRLIVLQRVVEGISVDQHRPRGRYFLGEAEYALVQMFDYILADEDTHIALSRWITRQVGDDSARLQELARYQAEKEQEYSEYSDWLVSKRRDLARLYPSVPAAKQTGED